jgi:hypothetical protein
MSGVCEFKSRCEQRRIRRRLAYGGAERHLRGSAEVKVKPLPRPRALNQGKSDSASEAPIADDAKASAEVDDRTVLAYRDVSPNATQEELVRSAKLDQ